MKKLLIAATLALTVALGGTAVAYTPTAEQCAAAGAAFNPATQGCDFSAPATITVGYGVRVTILPGQTVRGPGGTTVTNVNDTAGTVIFYQSNYFEGE